ncbi:FAD-binding protein [Sphingobium sp. JS3065]|uniref:FAD-binding protein n=1 Tax=Sphingobium sp. JS3065 TaxID=2970925 RepID=UPI002263BFC9|nr:FAD-binding protein [Sphingobium sp. JS3065]UZW57049.1 FAD-binding protein [Sphingobium sp. JS3065]
MANIDWDEEVDLLIVGSGAGSVTASLVARDAGLRPLIIEKQDLFGGTTSYSGGGIWIPCNPVMKRAGVPDSLEQARTYLDTLIDYDGPASTPARRNAFLQSGSEMISYLEEKGMKFTRPRDYPDYYPALPGGSVHSRTVIPQPFDINELGDWKARLAQYKGPPVPVGLDELSTLLLIKRTWKARWLALRLAFRLMGRKLAGKDVKAAGAALQGRLLQIALRAGVVPRMRTAMMSLVTEGDRVTGAIVSEDGRTKRIRARNGVLLNAGGFARNAEMRANVLGEPTSTEWSRATPGDTGDALNAAVAIGAATDALDSFWWGITSANVDGGYPEGAVADDGTIVPFGHHFDISYPHMIIVDQDGRRFANEACSYMELGQRLYARQRETGRAIPAWAIIESRHRDRYLWGTALGKTPASWIESGYMKKADSLEGLAAQCRIDGRGLLATIERFNGFAASGIDIDYQRGASAFDRAHGDPTVKPNPNLGAIERAPFYAVAIYPGDIGCAGGLVTDEDGRVLRKSGDPIEGLYATGNSTASVTGRSYPGAGSTLGPAMVFAYRAARHAARTNR